MMEKTKKWYRLLLFLPIILVVAVTNVIVDPANVFHSDISATTEAILNGNAVYFAAGNTDERGCKKCLVEKMPKDLDCITIGPSLSMGIRANTVGVKKYYNLSASGLQYYDYMALFGLLEFNQIKYDKLVLCVDSYFFDESIIARENRYTFWKEYAEYMEDILNKSDVIRSPKNGANLDDWFTKLSQVFSPAYFKSSVSNILENYKNLLKNIRWGIVHDDETAKYAHYETDGSWTYADSFINNDVEYVIKHSNDYDIKKQFGFGLHISEKRKEMFIKLIEFLIKKGVRIEFYLCPPAPALYDRISGSEAEKYSMPAEIEAFALEVAGKYNIKVTGTYNPYKLGIPNEDYLDSRHIRHEKIEQYFDFEF